MTNGTQTSCPCCLDPMDWEAIVCWACYHWTERLTPGTYFDCGSPSEITAVKIQSWEYQRRQRAFLARGSIVPLGIPS